MCLLQQFGANDSVPACRTGLLPGGQSRRPCRWRGGAWVRASSEHGSYKTVKAIFLTQMAQAKTRIRPCLSWLFQFAQNSGKMECLEGKVGGLADGVGVRGFECQHRVVCLHRLREREKVCVWVCMCVRERGGERGRGRER